MELAAVTNALTLISTANAFSECAPSTTAFKVHGAKLTCAD